MIKRFQDLQKLRVVTNGVSFYTTAQQVREGVGDLGRFNSATRQCLEALEITRSNDDVMACASGLAAIYEGIQIQIDMVTE
jgi:cystathionine beta-lyase/cystathionine gamma-synthase